MTRQIVHLLVASAVAAAALTGCAATAPSGDTEPAGTPTADRSTSSHHPGHSRHPGSAGPADAEPAPAGCTGEPDTDRSTGTSESTETSGSTDAPASDALASDLPPVEVDVRFLDGRVEPAPDRVDVPLGSTVVLWAETDTAAEIHVHGYDVTADAEPGEPVCLEVLADTPGVFDVEAHPETLLLQLAVR